MARARGFYCINILTAKARHGTMTEEMLLMVVRAPCYYEPVIIQKTMPNKLSYIPARNKIGAIIRTTDSSDRFNIIESAVDNLLKIGEISLIHIMIHGPEQNSELIKKLIKKYGQEKNRIAFVTVDAGNFYSDLLNYAFREQTRRGIDYSLSVSPEAFEYISRENFDKLVRSIKNGVLAAGLKIHEYSEIMDQGYFSNTFAIYRNSAINFADIWAIQGSVKNNDIGKATFGMEEVYAVKRLLEIYGPGVVEIITPENGKMTYANDEKSKAWREKTLKTKMERLKKMQSMLTIDPEELKKMIIWS